MTRRDAIYRVSNLTMKTLPRNFTKLLSAEELSEINKRIKIMELLKKGLTYKQISQKLGVGSATIARVAKKVDSSRHTNTFANKSVSKKQIKTKLSNYAFGISN